MIRKQGKPDENHGRETTKCRLGKRRPFFSLLSQNTLWWSAHIFIAFCNAFRRYLYLCKKIKILFWFYASSLHHSVYLFRSPLYHSFALRRSIHKLPEKCLSKFETFVKNFHKGRKDTFKQHREETFLPPTWHQRTRKLLLMLKNIHSWTKARNLRRRRYHQQNSFISPTKRKRCLKTQ